MKLDPKTSFALEQAQDISTDPVLSFVATHKEGLWHAARILGGYESARLVDRCVAILKQDRCLTRRSRIMLGRILAVISLDKVDDPNLPYLGFFAVIDPSNPVVEETCLLTDGLTSAIAEYNALRHVANRDAHAVKAVA